jgi:hypothetical protein
LARPVLILGRFVGGVEKGWNHNQFIQIQELKSEDCEGVLDEKTSLGGDILSELTGSGTGPLFPPLATMVIEGVNRCSIIVD